MSPTPGLAQSYSGPDMTISPAYNVAPLRHSMSGPQPPPTAASSIALTLHSTVADIDKAASTPIYVEFEGAETSSPRATSSSEQPVAKTSPDAPEQGGKGKKKGSQTRAKAKVLKVYPVLRTTPADYPESAALIQPPAPVGERRSTRSQKR